MEKVSWIGWMIDEWRVEGDDWIWFFFEEKKKKRSNQGGGEMKGAITRASNHGPRERERMRSKLHLFIYLKLLAIYLFGGNISDISWPNYIINIIKHIFKPI